MSDYFYNNEIPCIRSNERYFCQLKNNFDYNGNYAQERVFGQFEDGRNVQQREMFGQNCPKSDEGVITEDIDGCYEGKLESLSSSLIQLLGSVRQRSLQVKATCGVSQRPHLVKNNNPQGDDNNRSLDRHTERQPNSSVQTDGAECAGNFTEPGTIMPAVLGSTGTTFSNTAALPDLAYLRADEKAWTHPKPGVSESRLSAQALVTPLSDVPVDRERQRKLARNKREKKRRSAMTDSITELQNLLPEDANRPSCRQKGTILKKSIDYIKSLKDQNVIQRLEDKMREINMEIKTLTRRLERVELSSTISSPEQSQVKTTSEVPHINRRMTKSPDTCLKPNSLDSDPPLNEPRSDVPKVPSLSTSMSFNDVWDDFTSSPLVGEKGTDDMDCNI